jgi:hypothetical protein
MDTGTLMASLFFGLIGMGMLMYGRKAFRPVPMVVGLILIVLPYFISNLIAMVAICSALTAVPWFVREA